MALPASTREVTPDDMFEALARLGCPTVFLDADRDAPDASDMPQLAGALVSAVERLIIARELIFEPAQMSSYAAGYLASIGAQNGLCGITRAFDMITVRLQSTEMLFEGFLGTAPPMHLVRLALAAAVRFAVMASNGQHAGEPATADYAERTERARRAFGEATDALRRATELAAGLGEVTGWDRP